MKYDIFCRKMQKAIKKQQKDSTVFCVDNLIYEIMEWCYKNPEKLEKEIN
jgi:hypothetical protein